MVKMNKEEFVRAVKNIGIDLSERQIEQFEKYANFLLNYNKKTNLTAIKTFDEVYLKHFYDSILLFQYFDFAKKRVLDVGTGAGFPGVPLKICHPDVELVLLDANGKKTTFLERLKEELEIDYAVIHGRAEEYILEERENFDVVVSRAVSTMSILAELCLPFVRVGGHFIPYKGLLDETLEEGKYAVDILGGEVQKVISTKLPQSDANRTFVIIEKKCKTPAEYPRRFDKITKKPLQKR